MRKGFKKTRFIFILVVLLTLNFLGITYAYWEEGLDINMHLQTGNIFPEFVGALPISKKDTISVECGMDAININGKLKPHESAIIFYEITNKGSVPIKLADINFIKDDGIIVNNILPIGIIDTYGRQNGFGTIQIGALKEGQYNFELELIYGQFNSQEDNYEKTFSFID